MSGSCHSAYPGTFSCTFMFFCCGCCLTTKCPCRTISQTYIKFLPVDRLRLLYELHHVRLSVIYYNIHTSLKHDHPVELVEHYCTGVKCVINRQGMLLAVVPHHLLLQVWYYMSSIMWHALLSQVFFRCQHPACMCSHASIHETCHRADYVLLLPLLPPFGCSLRRKWRLRQSHS